MKNILDMVALGIIAGMISGFWTRIIRKKMVFSFIGEWLNKINNNHLIDTTKHSTLVMFLWCIFCIPVWLCLILDLFYIIEYNPWWIYAIIGVLGSLGSGNLVAEIISSLRNEE